MSRLCRASFIALTTFTRLPLPHREWDEKAQRLSLAFLPLPGIVISVVLWLWQLLCRQLEISNLLFAVVATALPIWITGGIHLDGYCDTWDALSSWQSKERRLEIMQDPHLGAFAVIHCCLYLLLSIALLSELRFLGLDIGIICIYPLSRCLAALSATWLPHAKREGMLVSLSASVSKNQVALLLIIFATPTLYIFYTLVGSLLLITELATMLVVTLYYLRVVSKYFDGTTGDTTGFYLQTLELAMLAGLIVGKVML